MILAFDHPCLVVFDLDKASQFYQQMFGFEVISNEGWEDSPEMDRAIGLKDSSCRGLMMKGHNCFLELFEYDSPSDNAPSPLSSPRNFVSCVMLGLPSIITR